MMLEELRGYDFIEFPYSDLDACEAVLREGARRGYRPRRSSNNAFLISLLGEMMTAEDRLDDLEPDAAPQR